MIRTAQGCQVRRPPVCFYRRLLVLYFRQFFSVIRQTGSRIKMFKETHEDDRLPIRRSIKMEGKEPMDLEAMRNIDIRTVDPDTLVDINDIKVDTTLLREERIRDFIRQIKNPYCFRCGGTVVKISFSDTKATLEDRLESYMKSLLK